MEEEVRMALIKLSRIFFLNCAKVINPTIMEVLGIEMPKTMSTIEKNSLDHVSTS
jgi:hypothetical protein